GSPACESGRAANEGPVHGVEITRPFYLGTCPVTQEQYQRVTGRNPSYFRKVAGWDTRTLDRKSTRLNSSHRTNSYAVFSLKKKIFYQPPGDYFHAPHVFRATEECNALLNTALMREDGRTAYISIPEMTSLEQKLARADLAW